MVFIAVRKAISVDTDQTAHLNSSQFAFPFLKSFEFYPRMIVQFKANTARVTRTVGL